MIEIIQVFALLPGHSLLCPCRFVPLLNDGLLFYELSNDTRSCATGKLREFNGGEKDMLVRENLARNTS